MLILKHVIFCITTCCIKCFQFCVLNSFLIYELMFCSFVILDASNLTVFLRYYCIQKSRLKLEMGFAIYHNDSKQNSGPLQYEHGKSVTLIKRAQSCSFSCESCLYLLLSLACVIPLYLCYALLGQTLNLLSFLIRSKINNLTKFCLSLQFLWILYFALRLLQHGDRELNPGSFSITSF